jgi:lipoprotein-anchoring transpeptidase ErfK/SrfK
MHGKASSQQPAKGRKTIKVDLTRQTVETYDGTERVHRFECISGDKDHPTDKGRFSVMRKHHPYRSRAYDVPMNYAMFFTLDGKALHQYHGPAFSVVRSMKTGVSDWFGSHGCVRLEEQDARALYDWAPLGTVVHVF